MNNIILSSSKRIVTVLSCIFIMLIVNTFSIFAQEPGSSQVKEIPGRWSVQKAEDWYDEQPWLVGCNYIPATAINQLEMWQAETFDPKTIEKELDWTRDLGFNTLRVYLHELRKQEENILQPGEAFPEPKVWFHDIYRIDGSPYSKDEIEFIRKMTGKKPKGYIYKRSIC